MRFLRHGLSRFAGQPPHLDEEVYASASAACCWWGLLTARHPPAAALAVPATTAVRAISPSG